MSAAGHTLQFVDRGPYFPFRKTLLSPTQIRDLSQLTPARAMGDIAVCWLWILAAMSAAVLHPAWWTVLAAIPVIGNRYYALFIVGHDEMHRRLFPSIK